MAHNTDCPSCGRTNVKGILNNSSAPGMMLTGGIGGLWLGPLGPLVGAPAGWCVGKAIDAAHKVLGGTKEYRYKCPRCGYKWYEKI